MFMIADRECREQHRDQLLRCYHDQFVATLNQLGSTAKPPTLLDIQVEVLRNGLMGRFDRQEWAEVLINMRFCSRILLGDQFLDDVLHGFFPNDRHRFLRQNSDANLHPPYVRERESEEPTDAPPAGIDEQGSLGCLMK